MSTLKEDREDMETSLEGEDFSIITTSGEECRECLTIFSRHLDTDVTWLVKHLSEISAFQNVSVYCSTSYVKERCIPLVDGSSVIILYYSHSPETPLPDLSDMEEFLDYCREKHSPENIKVVINGVEDIHWERLITNWWKTGKYWDWELLTISKAERKSLTEHKINPLSVERRMNNKLRHMHQILQEAAEEKAKQNTNKISAIFPFSWGLEETKSKYTIGIFSGSTIPDYSWIRHLLQSICFRDHVLEVILSDISDYTFNTEKSSFAILCFTKKEGQISGIEAADVQLIQQYKSLLGKDKLIIVMNDVEDSSDREKIRISKSHHDLEDLYHNLFLFTYHENQSEDRTLLSSLPNIDNIFQQVAKNEKK